MKRILKEQTGIAPPNINLSHIESFEGHGFWHLVFHYAAQLTQRFQVQPRGNVRSIEWFPLNVLPERSEIAHDGWALDVLQTIVGQR